MIFGMDIRTCAITHLQLVRKNVDLNFQNCSMGNIYFIHYCIRYCGNQWANCVFCFGAKCE